MTKYNIIICTPCIIAAMSKGARNLKKLKIIAKILATFRNNFYLCTVRMYVLTIR